MKIVTYIRVSTEKQGRSGLGMEAQKAAIAAYAAQHKATTIGEFVEVESGRKNARPQLHAALRLAKVTGATLVIAKLDRLSRNAALLLALQEAGTPFTCCDMPRANELTIGIMAIIAQAEAKAIAKRTKDAMAAAKAQGRTFGNPNGAEALRRAGKGNSASREAATANAVARAIDLADVLADIDAAGHKTLAAKAAELNARGIETPRGGKWYPTSVRNALARLAA